MSAWVCIALLTLGSMAVWRSDTEQDRLWRETHILDFNSRSWRRTETPSQPTPERYWAAWPRWVDELIPPAQRQIKQLQVGLVVLGTGLATLSLRRTSRRGPGRIASVVSTCWTALGTLCAIRYVFVHPKVPALTTYNWMETPASSTAFWFPMFGAGSYAVAESIAAAWLYLAVAGRWRRKPDDSIEYLGRWLGRLWIGTGFTLRLFDVLGMAPSSW